MFSALFKSRTNQKIQEISTKELHQQLSVENSYYLVDVRSPEEYARGHIHNTRLLPLQTIRQRLTELPTDKPLVCICQSGRRSVAAGEVLVEAGFSQVFNMTGGMNAWAKIDWKFQNNRKIDEQLNCG